MYRPEARLDDAPPSHIAILRAHQLGDLLATVPALRALRYALPDTHITLVLLLWVIDFFKRFRGYLDEFISFPGFSEQRAHSSDFSNFLLKLQKSNFELAIQMQEFFLHYAVHAAMTATALKVLSKAVRHLERDCEYAY